MLSVRDLIRVFRFPLQEVSDWISLARSSHLDYGAEAEVSLYLAGVPARPPTPLFTGVRGMGILHSPAPLELVTPMDRYARWWMSSYWKLMFALRRECPMPRPA